MNTSPGGWIIAAATIVFIVDLLVPLGYAVPMLYVLPILLTGLLPGRKSTILVIGAALLLTWIGVPLSPGAVTVEALTNRILATTLLFAIAWLLIVHKESAEKIAEAQWARDESEERLRLAMSAERFGTFDWDIPTQKVIWSAETERIWGLPVGGFEGTYEHWRRLVHPDDVAEAERKVRCSLDNPNIPYAFDHRIIRPNGTVGWIHAKATTVRGADGRPIRMVGVNADITAHKRVDEALRESEARFRTMAEAVPSFLFETDAAGWNIWTSDGWCRFTGQSHEQVAGHGWAEALHPDDRAANLQQWLHCMEHGIPFETKQRLCRVDGTYAWVIARALPVRDDHGKVTRWVGSVTDVDAIVRTEEALHESEKHFRSFFDNATVGAAQVNPAGRFTHVNDRFCQLTGYQRDELIGQMGPLDLDHPDDVEDDRKRMATFFQESTSYLLYEKRYVHKDGRTIWVSVTASPIRDEHGVIQTTAAIIGDITERKQAEEALAHLNATLERRVAERTAMLHEREVQLRDLNAKLLLVQEEERRRIARELHDDFTQRLAALTIGLQSLRAGSCESADSLSMRIEQLGNTAERLTTDLQRMAHHLHPSILEHVGLEAAVREHIEDFEARTNLKTELMVRAVPTTIPLDHATCLYRVLQESLQNVRKHANAAAVMIRLLKTERGVGLCVHDDGRGFEYSEDTRERNGLGLTSMAERVKALRGTFRVRTKPGDGTEVNAWVPLEQGEV